MKQIRKGLGILLALVMVMSFMPILSASAVTVNDFTDISASHWAYTYVKDMVDRGLFIGTSPTTFQPSIPMNRAMFITVLSRYAKVEVDDEAETQFEDVPTGQYYTGAVAWGAANDIVTGKTPTTYGPKDSVTREQMVTLIMRYLVTANITLPQDIEMPDFSDAARISPYAKDWMEQAMKAGIILGYEDGSVRPQGESTRAEVAAVCSRLIGILESLELGGPDVPLGPGPGGVRPERPGQDEPTPPPDTSLDAYTALRNALVAGIQNAKVSGIDITIGPAQAESTIDVINKRGASATLGDFLGATGITSIISGATGDVVINSITIEGITGVAAQTFNIDATGIAALITYATANAGKPLSDADGMTITFNFTHTGNANNPWTVKYTVTITDEEEEAKDALLDALLDAIAETGNIGLSVEIIGDTIRVTNNLGAGANLASFITATGIADIIGSTSGVVILEAKIVLADAPTTPRIMNPSDISGMIDIARDLGPKPISDANNMTIEFTFMYNDGGPYTRLFTVEVLSPAASAAYTDLQQAIEDGIFDATVPGMTVTVDTNFINVSVGSTAATLGSFLGNTDILSIINNTTLVDINEVTIVIGGKTYKLDDPSSFEQDLKDLKAEYENTSMSEANGMKISFNFSDGTEDYQRTYTVNVS